MTLTQLASAAAAALLAIAPSVSYTAELNLSDRPLFLTEGVDPNFFITLDNSDRMDLGYAPEEIESAGDESIRHTRRAKSINVNKLYYEPEVIYESPVLPDSVSFGQVPFNNAPLDPFLAVCRPSAPGVFPSGCPSVDLATDYRATWAPPQFADDPDPEGGGAPGGSVRPAYYYLFDDALPDCDGTPQDDDCYRRVDPTDPAFDEDNFSNWFSYYRTRLLTMKTVVSRVLSGVDRPMRVGYQAINPAGEANQNQYLAPLPLTGAEREGFFDWLFALATEPGTPLVGATRRIGEYVQTDTPYRQDPNDSDSRLAACRSNFHLLFSRGGWDDPAPATNSDGASGQAIPRPANPGALRPNSPTYTAQRPFADSRPSLADLGFEYWISDLRPEPNNVPTFIRRRALTSGGSVDRDATFWDAGNDPADWQHLVNFAIGIGAPSKIEPQLAGHPFAETTARDDALVEALKGGTLSWEDGNRLDDLWHLAINSRGRFYSPQSLAELDSALLAIIPPPVAPSVGGGQAVAQSSGTLTTDTALYQASFTAGTWTGRVRALSVCAGRNPDAADSPTNCDPPGALAPIWDSIDIFGESPQSLNPSDRLVITADPATGEGLPFRSFADLGTDQQNLLDRGDGRGADRLEYLRGSAALELRNGGPFRDRLEVDADGRTTGNRLGDILNSPPLYFGPPRRFYPDGLETSAYSAFRNANSGRSPLVFVGANDGMLHALDAATGAERFAYIPSSVFPNLWQLTSLDYAHASYVDGPLTEGDAFVGGGWRSLLAGGLGLGGQGVFLLDVTNPDAVTPSNLLRWELTDSDDPDLGFTYGRPEIIKRADSGAWAVVFGNGYNNTYPDDRPSTSGEAVLFVVNASDKTRRLKISTGVGRDRDPMGIERPNGIAFVTPVDKDADFDADHVYAGDLFGNLWRFDIEARRATKIFTAKDDDGKAQPITTAVRVVRHPTGRGFLVLFGTGKYIEGGSVDIGNTDPQTFYGIWDDLVNTIEITRAALLEQEVLTGEVRLAQTGETVSSTFAVRGVTNRRINWAAEPTSPPTAGQHLGWFIDLPESGERVHQSPAVRGDRVVFATVTPNDDPCSAGGDSWLMEIEWKDGSAVETISPFDFLQTGAFELLEVRPIGSGTTAATEPFLGGGLRMPGTGVYSAPIALVVSTAEERKLIHTSGGELIGIGESTGLNRFRPWREIR